MPAGILVEIVFNLQISLGRIIILMIILSLFQVFFFPIDLSNLYTQFGALTHGPKIQSHMLPQIGQPGTSILSLLFWEPGITSHLFQCLISISNVL